VAAQHAATVHAVVSQHASRVLESAATLVFGDDDKFDASKSFSQGNPEHFGEGYEHNRYLPPKEAEEEKPPIHCGIKVSGFQSELDAATVSVQLTFPGLLPRAEFGEWSVVDRVVNSVHRGRPIVLDTDKIVRKLSVVSEENSRRLVHASGHDRTTVDTALKNADGDFTSALHDLMANAVKTTSRSSITAS